MLRRKWAHQVGAVAEADAQGTGRFHCGALRIDAGEAADGFRDWHALDIWWPVADHLAEPALVYQPDGMRTKLRGQHTVKRGGVSASLEVPEHHGADLAVQPTTHLFSDQFANAAEPNLLFPVAFRGDEPAVRKRRTLGHHNQ